MLVRQNKITNPRDETAVINTLWKNTKMVVKVGGHRCAALLMRSAGAGDISVCSVSSDCASCLHLACHRVFENQVVVLTHLSRQSSVEYAIYGCTLFGFLLLYVMGKICQLSQAASGPSWCPLVLLIHLAKHPMAFTDVCYASVMPVTTTEVAGLTHGHRQLCQILFAGSENTTVFVKPFRHKQYHKPCSAHMSSYRDDIVV